MPTLTTQATQEQLEKSGYTNTNTFYSHAEIWEHNIDKTTLILERTNKTLKSLIGFIQLN